MSIHFSSGIRKSRSPRRLSARSEPPRVWLPPPARYDGAILVLADLPLRNVWMAEKTCALACERRDAPYLSREHRLALACLTDLYALGKTNALPQKSKTRQKRERREKLA